MKTLKRIYKNLTNKNFSNKHIYILLMPFEFLNKHNALMLRKFLNLNNRNDKSLFRNFPDIDHRFYWILTK